MVIPFDEVYGFNEHISESFDNVLLSLAIGPYRE